MGRRVIAAAVVLLLACCGAAAAASVRPVSWAAPQIRAVTAAGLMGSPRSLQSFQPDAPLTAQVLEDLVYGIKLRLTTASEGGDPGIAPVTTTTDPVTTTTDTATTDPTVSTTTVPTTTTTPAPPPPPKQVANPTRPVPMWELDARLVGALGLNDAASTFARAARAAGLAVPSRFGTEVVARMLGLRLDHPANQDALELRPQDTATRAEAAYSGAQILAFSDWTVQSVEQAAGAFSLPTLTDWQKRILTAAVSHIGMPYIWGGTSDSTETEFGITSRGGYDCSGFVWRVYKETWYPGEGSLAATLRGRTTYVMSVEVPKSKRIGFDELQPADVVFFGDKGPRSTSAQIGHMGIYLGNGWFIHSSEYGVAVANLSGWYRREFAWARRPLAEAGLAS